MTATPPAVRPALYRRLRNLALALAALLALYAVAGFFGVPRIAKSKIESFAQEELGRRATVGKVRFNPFTLRARISDFSLADRDPARTLLRFDRLDVNVSTASIWKRGPVLDAVRLAKPRVELARNAQGEYAIQDLIDRATAPSSGSEATFAVNNIEVEDGSVLLDDAVHGRKIEVSKLSIGIPFLSSFARDAQVRVTPRLSGAIDGTPFALNGRSTSPFEDTQQTTLDIDFDALSVPKYMQYAPLPNGLTLADGALTTRLALVFQTEKGRPSGMTLSGTVRLDRLAIARKDASPLMAAQAIEVGLGRLDLLARSLAIDRISIAEPMLDLRRLQDGTLELPRLLSVAPGAGAADAGAIPAGGAKPEGEDAPWSWWVTEARVAGGTVRVVDATVAPPFETRLSGVTATGTKLGSKSADATIDVSFDSEDGAHLVARGDVDFGARAARGRFGLTKLPLAKLRPYFGSVLAIDVRRGALDFGADFDAGTRPETRFALAQGSAAVSDLDVAIRGEREPLWRMARANAEGIALDLGERTVTVDRVEVERPTARVLRNADGTMHFEKALLRAGPGEANRPGADRVSEGADWHFVVRTLLLEHFGLALEDRVPEPDVKLQVADARIVAENLDSARGAKAKLDATARIGAKGRVRLDATVSRQPLAADARLTATALDLVPLRPYFESQTNIIVTSGAADAKGRFTYADAGTTGPQVRYVGDFVLGDFGSLDRPTSQELVRWKSLTLAGLDVTSAPFNLRLEAATLDGFFARLILNDDATLNVLKLLEANAGTPADAGAKAQPEFPPPRPAGEATREASLPPGERREIPASIGRIQLSNGEVRYSDFFVKPNYSAHLTDVNGSVSGLAVSQPGTVELTAKVDASAPVDIRGAVNPFARELALDLTGKATGVELPPLTPYSVKYAGYGIEKGKLSMEVHYKVDQRKLTATNKLVLDQLTFGAQVDSPTATKLPVLFAVSLLKDRNGVINLDLPIEGTLDDPRFSIWRVVVQIIVNLLTKAMTAPFALLGAIVGGGEQLAYVEFAPGSAELSPAAQAKLASLAKALVERPALKLDASGRAIAALERESLKREALERALRIRKQKHLASEGESAPALDAITVDAAERAKYLEEVYEDTDLPDKPRNFLGFAKRIPAAQMEAMLLASYRVDDETLRALANRRAQAVKEWFATKGSVPVERVFIAAPKLDAEGIKEGGAPTRVDFAIR